MEVGQKEADVIGHPHSRGVRKLALHQWLHRLPSPHRRGAHVLDDSTEVNAWLELIKWRGAFNELVTFFYDSFAVMAGRAGEFFGLQQGMYDSCGVSVS
jgi:hypothetical protein